ncbi:hypothetical protein F511_35493 [Dorcoceras hygrometricum]|uniref:NAC domain-containing protein n=1 Tax=Dorcoceras hygrometricum TaxID=472368 RepID=A0A2Z7CFV8_9LAMI|nr:hypothetical protein F511_35493 [Dorcoceras hygrometricum]
MERNQQSPTPANPNQEPGPNENAVPKFPLGMRFAPTEEQLICYLRKKIKNEPFEDVCICSVNFYKYNPWELTDVHCDGTIDGTNRVVAANYVDT